MNAYTPLTKIPAYSGAKSCNFQLYRMACSAFFQVGIRCNAIAPGFFSTQQNAKLLFNEDGTPTARTGKILNNTPMDRFGEVEELIGSVLFLACEEAKRICQWRMYSDRRSICGILRRIKACKGAGRGGNT